MGMSRSWLMVGIVLTTALPTTSKSVWHPKDGPDVDLKITLREDSVRLHVTMNLAFLDAVCSVSRTDLDTLSPSEQTRAKNALLPVLSKVNRITVDGVTVNPLASDFAFVPGEVDLLPLFPNLGMRALTRCRIVLDYPLKSEPRRVSVRWGLYPKDPSVAAKDGGEPPSIIVNAVLFADGVVSDVTFLKSEPEYVWQNSSAAPRERFLAVPKPVPAAPRRVPAFSLLLGTLWLASGVWFGRGRGRRSWLLALPLILVAAIYSREVFVIELHETTAVSRPTEEEALGIFLPLHANIYRAFDYIDEDAIYDALALSVSGRLLDETYREIHESLVLAEEGGAVCRVVAVRPLETTVEAVNAGGLDASSFNVLARWQVDGKVTHWGHSHGRTNEYCARYTVVPMGDSWRIAASEVLEQRRISGSPQADEGR